MTSFTSCEESRGKSRLNVGMCVWLRAFEGPEALNVCATKTQLVSTKLTSIALLLWNSKLMIGFKTSMDISSQPVGFLLLKEVLESLGLFGLLVYL